LIVFSLKDKTIQNGDYSKIEYWLGTLAASVKHDMENGVDFGSRINSLSSWLAATVMLVGTHADCVTPEVAESTMAAIKSGLSNFPLRHVFAVSSHTGRDVSKYVSERKEVGISSKSF